MTHPALHSPACITIIPGGLTDQKLAENLLKRLRYGLFGGYAVEDRWPARHRKRKNTLRSNSKNMQS